MIDTFIACMKQKGWGIELYKTRNNYLPEEIANRYKNIPSIWSVKNRLNTKPINDRER